MRARTTREALLEKRLLALSAGARDGWGEPRSLRIELEGAQHRIDELMNWPIPLDEEELRELAELQALSTLAEDELRMLAQDVVVAPCGPEDFGGSDYPEGT